MLGSCASSIRDPYCVALGAPRRAATNVGLMPQRQMTELRALMNREGQRDRASSRGPIQTRRSGSNLHLAR